jgi:TatD DNase family protein
MIPYIDTHAHLSLLRRRGIDPHQTLRELFAAGFAGIIDISLEPGDLPARMAEFSLYPTVRFASGLWPHASSIADRAALVPALEKDIAATRGAATRGDDANGNAAICGGAANSGVAGPVCALGEFGLDRHRNGEDVPGGSADEKGERELMEMQMDMARRLSLPVIIHSRDAPGETAEILKRFPEVGGVIHCYSYGAEEVNIFLDMGYFISFAGNLTYKNAQNIRDACVLVPSERILLETDCPYLAPVPHRGQPAHPGMVQETYRLAAEIRKTTVETLVEQTAENTAALFGVRF